MSSRPTKRARRDGIGAPSADDQVDQRQSNTISSGRCTRAVSTSLPALTTLCARVFVKVETLQTLYRHPVKWKATVARIQRISDPILPRLFAMLRRETAGFLSHEFILNFLTGSSITLTKELTGLKLKTLTAISAAGPTLQHLSLVNLDTFTDTQFALLFSNLSRLTSLSLAGCTKVALATSTAVGKHCSLLEAVNLSSTGISPQTLVIFSESCLKLRVFKASLVSWTDATLGKHMSSIKPLPNLRALKLKQTKLSETSLTPLLALCPNIERLDIGFTVLRRPRTLVISPPPLQKLNLTKTGISADDLLAIIRLIPHVRWLGIGVLGGRGERAISSRIDSSLILTDSVLEELTQALRDWDKDPVTGRQVLESVNLVGNAKIGGTSQIALANFIGRIGRHCKYLNLTGIPNASSAAFEGLLNEGHVQLETLLLNNTAVDDQAAPYISACTSLTTLEVAGTKFTSAGLFPIIDACTSLVTLDLTSCRGVSLNERRRFFEVWETEWKDN